MLFGCWLFLFFCGLFEVSQGDHPLTPNYNAGGLLWPQPTSIQQGDNQLQLNPTTFSFQPTGAVNGILSRAFVRYLKLCFPNNALNQLLRNAQPQPNVITELSVFVQTATETDQIQLGVDESYTLTVSSSQNLLRSKTVFGALRGLETFSQLIINNANTYTINITNITDTPRFPWRGILIDSSRHWLPVSTIKDTIAAMSYSKMNTLHWHIVDGQSFPLESKVYPLLAQEGAYHLNQIYTQADVKDIVTFANDHGVRVVPEFDMPAHSSSWGFGYDYMTVKCFGRQNEFDFNDGWGDDPMDPTNPQVYEFIQNFLTEISPLFPDDWLHLGGDEINYNCWNIPSINAYMRDHGIKSYNDLEEQFIQNINTFVKSKLNKKLVYWQEVFDETSPFIGTAVDIWLDSQTLLKVIQQGIDGIQSFGWYLDHLDDDWSTFYNKEPIPSGATPAQAALVLGGEGSMWGETVDFTNIQQKIWPRACAIAERLWSPVTTTNTTLAIPRLAIHRCRLVGRGIPAQPFQPGPGCY